MEGSVILEVSVFVDIWDGKHSSRTSSLFNGTLFWTEDPSWPSGSCSLNSFGWFPRVCLTPPAACLLLIPAPQSSPALPATAVSLCHPSTACTPPHLGKQTWLGLCEIKGVQSGEQNRKQGLGRSICYERYQRICIFLYFNHFWVSWTQV